jgi:choloylglycine hydrolase
VPLFFDAVNECGLAAAALNFPMSAVYLPSVAGKRNIPSYELISRVLAECRTLGEAAELLRGVNVTPESFSESMPATPLHWMLSDGREAIVAEPLSGGLSVMPCPSGVLTNDPPYEYQLLRLTEYMSLVPSAPENRLIPDFEPKIYSGGLVAMGLPGDMSSTSRHIRAAYAAAYTLSGGSEWDEVSRFFHIASAVGVPDGTSVSPEGKPAKTRYTALYDITHKTYYARTYDSHRIFSLPYAEIPRDGGIKRYPFPAGGGATPLCAL